MEKEKKKFVETTKETTFAMFDIAKVQSVTIGVTIPLATPYSNIRLEVTADDPETARRCIIETVSTVLPLNNANDRDAVNRYMNNVLVRSPWPHSRRWATMTEELIKKVAKLWVENGGDSEGVLWSVQAIYKEVKRLEGEWPPPQHRRTSRWHQLMNIS
jgi:hypothetical protein